jgi:glycerol-3-phosphate dehydrogenase
MSDFFDLLVVGGGINGVGIARDAAGRGLKVALCEKGDLAGGTSSASSKMIHGGLRYLEHGAFRLVRESLAEREVLLATAPHLVHPMRFVLPHGPGSRSRWMVRAGLFFYDRLGGGRSLPGSASVDLRQGPLGSPLRAGGDGFVYSDCVVDDARLTVANARDAARHGAEILTRTALAAARRDAGAWRATLAAEDGTTREATARILVNAAGPWASEVRARAGLSGPANLRLVKGSHIVVPRLYPHDHAYLLQNDDRRVVFTIPFEGAYTLIGTTEAAANGPQAGDVTAEEVAYLCRAVGRWFARAPGPADVVWRFAGVRPLYDDGARSAAAATRDYVFELDAADAPALSIFGGKLTTYRRLAEAALARLSVHLPGAGPPWTAAAPLPGADGLPAGGLAVLVVELGREFPACDAATVERLGRLYGSDARAILAQGEEELAGGLLKSEVDWLIREEWARTAEDILWRRTKLGLGASPAAEPALAAYLGG